MKKTILLLLVVSSTFFTSCVSDDSSNSFESNSFLEIGNYGTDILDGLAENYGEDFGDGESYNIDLTFYNYTFDELDNFSSAPNDLVGIYFEEYSPTANRLAHGIYDYTFTRESYSFSNAFIIYANEDVQIVSGTLEVYNSDYDYYDVVFEGVDIDGNDIYFEYIDYVYNDDSPELFIVNKSLKRDNKKKLVKQ